MKNSREWTGGAQRPGPGNIEPLAKTELPFGVKNADEFVLNPSPSYYLHAGERIIIMGALAQIEKAKELL